MNRGIIFMFAISAFMPFLTSACDRTPPDMVRVPAGEFIMGTDEVDAEDKATEYGITKPWFQDEHPAHPVNLPTFYIDKYEVTHSRYREFVQKTGRQAPPDWNQGRYPQGLDNHPVIHVTWDDASAYCHWAGKRLPTEAEWEKAARGADGRRYPWGDEFEESRGNFNNQVGRTAPVGRYESGRSPYGAYDMTGNVWEWTADWYGPYPGNSHQSPLFGRRVRVLRGNSWAGLGHYPPDIEREIKAHYSRASFRFFMSPDGIVNDAGFRCAKSQ